MDMKRFFVALMLLFGAMSVGAQTKSMYNVLDYGAVSGDERSDSGAINAAIEAANANGGGTVFVPAGTYDCFVIELMSNVTLMLDSGCVLRAALPTEQEGYVERLEDGSFAKWDGSLFIAKNIFNAAVVGSGLIDGAGVVTRGFGTDIPYPVPSRIFTVRESRNLLFRDFSVSMGGARVLWLVGADNVTIDNLKIDSNRDGIDIDCCANVRVSNCTVNCLNDDGIVLKSAYSLGYIKPCENITITNCQVSGYDPGTFLTGEFGKTITKAPDLDGPTGRIKMGTESLGGFKNITISNCVFDHCRGIAIECVDGGTIEDINISNISMRDICNSPFFIRLGNRGRGPAGRPVGTIRRVNISNMTVKDADCRYASIIAGIPGYKVEDVTVNNLFISYKGGLTMEDARNQLLSNTFFTSEGITGKGGPNSGGLPKEDRDLIQSREPYDIPECETSYPEPSIFGVLPVYGLFVRHAKNIRFNNVQIETENPDLRPAILIEDVEGIKFNDLSVEKVAEMPYFVLKDVKDFEVLNSTNIKSTFIKFATDKQIFK